MKLTELKSQLASQAGFAQINNDELKAAFVQALDNGKSTYAGHAVECLDSVYHHMDDYGAPEHTFALICQIGPYRVGYAELHGETHMDTLEDETTVAEWAAGWDDDGALPEWLAN